MLPKQKNQNELILLHQNSTLWPEFVGKAPPNRNNAVIPDEVAKKSWDTVGENTKWGKRHHPIGTTQLFLKMNIFINLDGLHGNS